MDPFEIVSANEIHVFFTCCPKTEEELSEIISAARAENLSICFTVDKSNFLSFFESTHKIEIRTMELDGQRIEIKLVKKL